METNFDTLQSDAEIGHAILCDDPYMSLKELREELEYFHDSPYSIDEWKAIKHLIVQMVLN